jgi:hypothetical protein
MSNQLILSYTDPARLVLCDDTFQQLSDCLLVLVKCSWIVSFVSFCKTLTGVDHKNKCS